jgi:6-phosphogluconolactonase
MTLAFANYSGGSFGTLSLDESGKPLKLISYEEMSGTGPNTIRQEAPHAHGVYFDRSNQHLFIPDLGIDKVLVRKFDSKSAQLSPAQDLNLLPGSGPRHMAFSPDEKNAYVINELSNTVTVVKYEKASAGFTAIQEISTLPNESKTANSTAEIEVHPSGKFVYGSNRGHDSIVVFQRNETDGKLQLVQHAPCGGKTPRHFKIHRSGKWLLCAHQNSDSLSVLSLDTESGKLGEPSSTVSVPKPNCILFR